MAVLKLNMAPGPPSPGDYKDFIRLLEFKIGELKDERDSLKKTCVELLQRLQMVEAQRDDYVTLFQRFGVRYVVPRR